MNIVFAILIFSLIIIFHELGHFLLAKANGIRVNEFSLGLGPTIVGFTKGETKYCINLLPFGGACMMEGEDDESDDNRSFSKKSVWARISVVVAGPVFNFIMAFILAVIVLGMAGYDEPVISGVIPGFSAEKAGMQEGDRIIKFDHKKIHFYREISFYAYFHTKEDVSVLYERDGKEHKTTLVPVYSEKDGRYLLGLVGNSQRTRGNVFQTLKYSVYEVKYWISTTLESLKMLVTGKVGFNDLSGPVGIVQSIGDTYNESKSSGAYYVFLNMANICILLSANLGVMNLLPIPALDGGRLVFLVIEAIRKKRFNPEKEGMIHYVGLILLLLLMVVIFFNDIRKIFM
ncbi:MAG: RIP metalloprotease RseP [Lachnospiraceae bacterium]